MVSASLTAPSSEPCWGVNGRLGRHTCWQVGEARQLHVAMEVRTAVCIDHPGLIPCDTLPVRMPRPDAPAFLEGRSTRMEVARSGCCQSVVTDVRLMSTDLQGSNTRSEQHRSLKQNPLIGLGMQQAAEPTLG
jgi:hypothetical protein